MSPDRQDITILMPCKDQKREFLTDALRSVLGQSSPCWRLIVAIDPETPPAVQEILRKVKDDRILIKLSGANSFGGALNTGMKSAETEYVCILLSDDRFDLRAVEVLRRYITRFPKIDFFHSSRRHIDAKGDLKGPVFPSRRNFHLEDFKKTGSPVKHLLCWRRDMGLAIGGMDVTFSLHSCDDYDFPWNMAEAGAKFQAISECLYYYRVHHESPRLTTHVPITKQIEIIKIMFRKHGASESEISRYLQRAVGNYLVKNKLLNYDTKKNYEKYFLRINF